jgi:hypothetical protein
MAAMIKHE